jgi:RNA polymerase sigma factor (sigma-70 family)
LSNVATIPEQELLKLASQGDRSAFAIVYERAWPVLFRTLSILLLSKEEAEEMAQDIFAKLWQKKELLGELRSIDDYLFRMAKNEIGMQARHQAVKDRVLIKLAELHVAAPSADEELIYKEYHEAAVQAISQLTERSRRIFLMRTQSDLTLEQIADQLGISVSAVKKQLYAAIHSVKEYLRQNQSFPSLLLFSLLAERLF